MRRFLFFVFAILAIGIAPAFAQTETTTGSINGVITESSGGAIPGVTVTATNTQTGLTRTAVTESDGSYRIPLLPPGDYRVSAELSGLGTAMRERVNVLLGSSSKVDLSIRAQITEEITVTAGAPVVDVTQSGATEAVTQSEIENLPILGRDFKDLVLLTPGVATSFGGRVSLAGARGTATDYNIDGANANSDFFAEERGGTAAPYVFSQAAIREFQVIRTTYSVEYSRGGGGTMNAITKSGTNDFTGEAFFYRRDAEWADPREIRGAEEFFDARDVDQYGAAFGGPVLRDRLFFFLNGDFQKVQEPFTIADFRNRTQFQALSPDIRQALVSRLEQLVGHSLDQEFTYDTRENQDTFLAKVDWNIGMSNHFNLRWNYSDFNNFPSESSGTLSNQGDEYNTVDSAVGQLDSIFSPSLYNSALVQYSLEKRPINALTTSFPQTGIEGMGGTVFFGQRDFLPNGTDEEKYEIKDTLSYHLGNHQFKAGFNYMTVDISNLFVRDRAGDFLFANPQTFLNNTPRRFEQGAGVGSGATVFDFDQWGLFIMDSWRPYTKLTLDYGVRYDAQKMPTPFRNVYESRYPNLDDDFKDDTDNIAPRVGFAYDLRGDGRSVVRGGVGMYYNFIPAILYAQPLQTISGVFSNYVFDCTRVTCPTFPNLFTIDQLNSFDPSATLDLFLVSPDLEAQESIRGSLGFEQQLGRDYSVEVEGIYGVQDKIQRFINVNATPTGLMFGDLPQYTITSPNRPYPTFQNARMHVSDAEANYKAVTVALQKLARGNNRFGWRAHYTWSEAIDQDSNSRSTSSHFTYDPYNAELSEGPADYDVTHRVVASATYELPFGFLVAGIFNWRTGQPYTRGILFTGGAQSLTGLTRYTVTTPVYVDENGDIIDLTQASGSTPAEFANFLNSRGARILGRNTENHPDFMNIDLRFSKRFGLPYGLSIELIGEVFNVTNEVNEFLTGSATSLGRVNEFQIAQSGSGANLRYTITRNPNYGVPNAIDFNSPPRQYQAAVKIHF